MTSIRPFKHIKHKDLWLRCSHSNTMLVNEILQLAWVKEVPCPVAELGEPPAAGGLAFDPWCRLYHCLPDEGMVERVGWAYKKAVAAQEEEARPVALFQESGCGASGDFIAEAKETPLKAPLGITVDSCGNLFISESCANRVLVYDLMEPRLLRKVPVYPHRPLDCDHMDQRVYLLLDEPVKVMIMEARLGPWDIAIEEGAGSGKAPGEEEMNTPAAADNFFCCIPGSGEEGMDTAVSEGGGGNAPTGSDEKEGLSAYGTPSRICLGQDGVIYLLFNGGKEDAVIVPLKPVREDDPLSFRVESKRIISFPFVTDLTFMFDGESTSSAPSELLVMSRRPGEDFLVVSMDARGNVEQRAPLTARRYDGRGIACTPDNRIIFWTSEGYRHAVAARVRYRALGQCTTFALDSGRFRTVWGRIFVDACIPSGANIRLHYYTSDELPENSEPLPRSLPCGHLAGEVRRQELSPSMPPLSKIPVPGSGKVIRTLYRRTTGNEVAWSRKETEDSFVTYEAPVIGGAGRYLWVTLELTGSTRSTPRVAGIRVEHPSHELLKRLPKIYSRDRAAADFLRRYLAMFEGEIADLSVRAFNRHSLLSPAGAPKEILSWLGDFVGLVLDHRWPEDVKRRAIGEAIWLFRFRGTIKGLKRFMEIYLGREPVIIEHYQVRGMGGALVGPDGPPASKPLVGAGFRVGGAIGEPGDPLEASDDGFDTHAHRFSVVLPVELTDEQLEVVREILELHRPAHTLYEICTVDSGMRLGIGLYVGLTSMVGATAGFGKIQVGASLLGRGFVLWHRRMGISLTGSRIGKDTGTG